MYTNTIPSFGEIIVEPIPGGGVGGGGRIVGVAVAGNRVVVEVAGRDVEVNKIGIVWLGRATVWVVL